MELTRRTLLGAAATGAIAACWSSREAHASEAATAPTGDLPPVTRIRKIYLAKPVPTWPKPSLDVAAEVQRIEQSLAGMADKLDGIRLEGGDLYRVPADVPTKAADLGNPDGLLVFNLTSTVGTHLQRLAALDLPTVLYSKPFSGHDWSFVPVLQKEGRRVICLATSDWSEIPPACRLLRTTHLLRSTRVLFVDTAPFNAQRAAQIKERFGVQIVSVGADRVNAAYQAIDEASVRQEVQDWIKNAVKVVEPSEQDLANSARLYLAIRGLMKEEQAQAVTVNCLALFGAKVLPAYPCLTFSKLNDVGLTGVCEGDVDSTLTQIIFNYAFGVPGFVSDPVVDTASNTVIHAHCVSATRMDGPSGPRAPYIIRSHLEDNKGAALQVQMRVGQVITAAKLANLDTMLISTGTITGNPDLDRGCRTKITTKVADARKLMRGYTGGLHRVIFYGDRVQAIRDLAALLRFTVVEEC